MPQRWIWIAICWLALTWGAAAANAAEPPTPPAGFDREAYLEGARSDVRLRLGRVDCLAYALQNNTAIRIKRLQPLLAEADTRQAQATFDPSLIFEGILSDSTELSPNLIYGTNISMMRSGALKAGLTGKLWSGAQYELALDAGRFKSSSPTALIDPAYRLEPQLTITQPLLRGAGITVNQAAIIIARNNLLLSSNNVQETAMDITSQTLVAYYDLYHGRAYLAIEMEALERARLLLSINQARHAKGLISSVDLLETETELAKRMKRVIAAEAAMLNAEDALKLVTNLVDDPALWNAQVELLEEPVLSLRRIQLVQSLERAFDHRLDYQALKIALANRDIQIQVARNNLWPTLDLIGSFGLNGLGQDWSEAAEYANLDYKDWMAGLRLTIPWGRANRAAYDKSRWEKIQALLELKRLEQDIIFQVRNRVREVEIQYRQMEAAMLASDLEAENYEAYQERYAAGHISTHDILDYHNRLATARLDYIKALIDYQIGLIRLDQAEGMTLVRNNITLEN